MVHRCSGGVAGDEGTECAVKLMSRATARADQVEALDKELQGLLAMNTWEILPLSKLPPGANLMNCHVIFDTKLTETGAVERFKARVVVDGRTQRDGVDYDRVFSTVVKMSTLRMLLVLAVSRSMLLSSVDVKQAFLLADLPDDQPLFMRLPLDNLSIAMLISLVEAASALCAFIDAILVFMTKPTL